MNIKPYEVFMYKADVRFWDIAIIPIVSVP